METLLLYLPIFLALYVFTNKLFHKIRNLPPSPYPPFPIIGHLYLLKKPLHRTLSTFNSHGSVLFFQFGFRPVLVVSSPEATEECLTKNDIIFANRPRLALGKYLAYNYTQLAWAPYGSHWRNLRRISSIEMLSTHRLQMLCDVRAEEIRSLIHGLLSKKDERVCMRTLFFEITFNLMMRMIAGKRYYGENVGDLEEARKFHNTMTESQRVVGPANNIGDFLPFMRWIGLGVKVKELQELQRKRDEFVQNLIEEHRKKMVSDCSSLSGGRKTMIDVLLKLQETEPEYYKDEIIRGLVLVLLMAGVDTSVNTMEWAFSLLVNHPQVLKKAQLEINNYVGDNRVMNESDVAQLPYLHGIISETLRMYPAVPLLIPHESSEESTVKGFRIPRGTMLLVNLWSIQNDPKIWENPTSFRPERFEGVEGVRDGFRLMPFGSGRRGCPGEGLAMRMVGLTLGSLIQCFEWERESEQLVDMKEGSGFTLARAQPLYLKCRPRADIVELLSQAH
ncbi:Cytochrome P450 [Tripterygium wilfordii]|uniref:Cytochrome P450 n=1 Tax=Tripterygium wilfordii TaxID=458696 RepID=A0A7J7DKX6_TRIWF|nr:cytochrome P450 81Q32-like [Tripterygium wilfordii]KAF5747022.1 Cytochrome P450 [Tripterygium wilfordii]